MDVNPDNKSQNTMEIKQKKEQYSQEIRKNRNAALLNAKRKKILLRDRLQNSKNSIEQSNPTIESVPDPFSLPKKKRMQEAANTLITALKEKNENMILSAIQELRTCISEDENIPVDEFISLDLNQSLIVLFSEWGNNIDILRELLWIAINIFSAPYTKISSLYSKELIRSIIQCLSHSDLEIVESAAQTLSNIAGDINQTISLLLEEKIAEAVLALLGQSKNLTEEILLHISSLIANLFRYRTSKPELYPLLTVAHNLCGLNNKEIICNCMWAFANATLWPEESLKVIISSVPDLPAILMKALDETSGEIFSPALRTIGNLGSYTNELALTRMMELGLLQKLKVLMKSKADEVRLETIWIISNILAEDSYAISKVISEGILAEIMAQAQNEIPQVLEEILLCIHNVIEKGTIMQVNSMYKFGMMNAIVDCLKKVDYPRVVIKALICYEKLLALGEQLKEYHKLGVNPLVAALENAGAVRDFESLQKHSNEKIYELANRIIDTYFTGQQAS